MQAGSEGAELLGLHVNATSIRFVFLTEADEVWVELPLTPAAYHALGHLAAVHGHDPGCASAPAVHVDLLLRALAASDTRPACVVVRVLDRPKVWLRLIGRRGPVDLDLNVLDAFCLLTSRRIAVRLERPVPPEPDDTAAGDWDAALRRLLDQR
jgi:hypothetical protein